MSEPEREKRLWKIDPATFQRLPKAKLYQTYLLQPARSLGRHGLLMLLFAYPLILVTIGVEFGGLVFWTSFVGSIAAMALLISRLGFSRNFQNWDISWMKMFALVAAFLVAVGFYMGLIYLKTWFVPVAFTILAVGVVVVVKKAKT